MKDLNKLEWKIYVIHYALMRRLHYDVAWFVRKFLFFVILFNPINWFVKKNRIIKILFEFGWDNVLWWYGKFCQLFKVAGDDRQDFWLPPIEQVVHYMRTGRFVIEKSESPLAKLIHGKSVAVVGPAYNLEATGEEIESFDFVMRTSHAPGQNYQVELYGRRTDIAFYNYEALSTGDEAKFAALAREKVFMVFKAEVKPEIQAPLVKLGIAQYCRPNNLFPFGHGNQFTYLLNDLLHMSPARLKVFKIDLYTGDTLYDPQFAPPKLADMIYSIAEHDALSQIVFIKPAYRKGQFDADKTLTSVLSLSNLGYMRLLQKKFKKRLADQESSHA